MVRPFTIYSTLLLLLILLLVNSCREEEMELIQEEDTIEANSLIATRIIQTVTNDGSVDNILDRANCVRIEYPVEVMVNSILVVVNSIDDLFTVEAIFDNEDDDINTLDISYPITATLSDYSEVVVNSSQELIELSTNCLGENVIDNDIECLDFVYPITASVFNTSNELIETISVVNDNQLYNFTQNIETTDIVSINFPIIVELQDTTQITINSLTELQSTINTYENTCDEDDDFDFEDDDCDTCTTEQLRDALVNCEDWIVKDLERDSINYDDFYDNFTFNFFDDNTVISVWGPNSASGTWTASGSGNAITVVINIPELPLCNNTWILHEIQDYNNETKIDFRVSNTDRLRYVQNCNQ